MFKEIKEKINQFKAKHPQFAYVDFLVCQLFLSDTSLKLPYQFEYGSSLRDDIGRLENDIYDIYDNAVISEFCTQNKEFVQEEIKYWRHRLELNVFPAEGGIIRWEDNDKLGDLRYKLNGLMDHILVGDYYEDCRLHPCLCIEAAPENDDLGGISLIDGTYGHCGYHGEKLTLRDALKIKFCGPQGSVWEEYKHIFEDDGVNPNSAKLRWWNEYTVSQWEDVEKNLS